MFAAETALCKWLAERARESKIAKVDSTTIKADGSIHAESK